jgi:hypothetical protein
VTAQKQFDCAVITKVNAKILRSAEPFELLHSNCQHPSNMRTIMSNGNELAVPFNKT